MDEPAGRMRRQYLHVFAAAACIVPFLSYVLTDLSWTPREIGTATAVLAISGIVTAPAWGWLDDEFPGVAPRAALAATAAAALLVAVAVGAPQHWPMLVAVGIFGASSSSLEALLTTGALRGERTAARIGAVRAAGSAGWVLGLGLGATAITVAKHQPAWLFVVAAAAVVTAPRPARRSQLGRVGLSNYVRKRKFESPTSGTRAGWPLRPVLGVLSLTLPVPLAVSTLVQFTAGWAHSDLGAGPYAAVAPIALSAALELPAFVVVDRFARGRSSVLVVTAAMPPIALALGILAAFPHGATLVLVQPLVATAFALWFVGQSRLISERVAPERLASAQTLGAVLSRGVSAPTAGVLGGALATVAGYPALFATVAGIACLGLARGLVELRLEGRRGRRTAVARAAWEPS
jgi:PPP family 3-phenylpropionic acid transporter